MYIVLLTTVQVAFVEETWWESFLSPLMSVQSRAFIVITTPPPSVTSFFQQFIESIKKANAEGDVYWKLFNQSLICSHCAELGSTRRCTHALQNIPAWKSLKRLEAQKRLVPASKQHVFAVENYGCVLVQVTIFYCISLASF